jgi:hypothetical protein
MCVCVYIQCYRRKGQNFGRAFLKLTAVTHLLITKFILKLAGICGFCNVNICNFIKVACEWHKAINCNCKVPRIRVILLTVRNTIHHNGMLSGDVTSLHGCFLMCWHCILVSACTLDESPAMHFSQPSQECSLARTSASRHTELIRTPPDIYRSWTQRKSTIFNCHYLPNRSTLDIGVLGFFDVV